MINVKTTLKVKNKILLKYMYYILTLLKSIFIYGCCASAVRESERERDREKQKKREIPSLTFCPW